MPNVPVLNATRIPTVLLHPGQRTVMSINTSFNPLPSCDYFVCAPDGLVFLDVLAVRGEEAPLSCHVVGPVWTRLRLDYPLEYVITAWTHVPRRLQYYAYNLGVKNPTQYKSEDQAPVSTDMAAGGGCTVCIPGTTKNRDEQMTCRSRILLADGGVRIFYRPSGHSDENIPLDRCIPLTSYLSAASTSASEEIELPTIVIHPLSSPDDSKQPPDAGCIVWMFSGVSPNYANVYYQASQIWENKAEKEIFLPPHEGVLADGDMLDPVHTIRTDSVLATSSTWWPRA